MEDRKTVYDQTVKTMVVLAKCLEELAVRNEYTGDTTMQVYLDRAMIDLSKGLVAATLHVACYNEQEDKDDGK